MNDARAIIAKLRTRQTPSHAMNCAGLPKGSRISQSQTRKAGAFAMAVCLNGIGDVGRVALTMAMRDSGRVLDWDLPGPGA